MSQIKKFLLLLIGVIIILAGLRELNTLKQQTIKPQPLPTPTNPAQVSIISTSPPNLDGATITPAQDISITFSDPVQNKDEFRSSITPVIEYTIQLSSDRKTVTIIPAQPYGFNQGYTFHISSQTKFDGGKKMPTDKDINFKTIDYSGA